MSEREPKAIIEAAERAANSGDFAAAERLLRKAAEVQEANHGPLHPDLANTLNNLGVVCEMNGDFDQAERCFRRAFEIASAVLEPGHPIVATSRKNLEDFCAARGRPFAGPSAKSEETETASASELRITPPAVLPAATPLEPPIAPPPPPATTPLKQPDLVARTPARVTPIEEPKDLRRGPASAPEKPKAAPLNARSLEGMAIAIILVVLALLAGYRLLRPSTPPETTTPTRPAETASSAPGSKPATAPGLKEPAPATKPSPAPPASAAKRKDGKAPAPVAASGPVSVVSAEVCRNLRTGSWRCDPLPNPVDPGQVYFYTRVKSARDTVVLHRWFRDKRMIKSSELTIRANPTAGYRTYSRHTVASGSWRVELRTKGGELLQEERFSVR